jgi:inosose dehydratase
VVDFVRAHAPRIKTMHVKDINPAVLEEGRAREWDYATFSRQGIFAEMGEGMVDFPAVFELLRDAGFDGWIITETDVTQRPTALESAIVSREYLRGIGI